MSKKSCPNPQSPQYGDLFSNFYASDFHEITTIIRPKNRQKNCVPIPNRHNMVIFFRFFMRPIFTKSQQAYGQKIAKKNVWTSPIATIR